MALVAPYPQAQLTPLIGRAAELEAIVQRLAGKETRLLTLVGPAGVGKTRLALEAVSRLASHFTDGAFFVDLAPIREPGLVIPTIARAVGLLDGGSRPIAERLFEYARSRELLLVLDNFEQVLPAAADLPQLLSAAPALKVLVTSRAPLRLRWEQTLHVVPLPLPDAEASPAVEEVLQVPSVALFVERAQAHRADFVPAEQTIPLLVQLSRQLDGLPLAIELAAAQVQALPLAVIVRRLTRRVQSLQWNAHDLPARQRSLQAAIDWSYELLTEEEQTLFRHLGAFVGRVSLDAMAAVREDDDGDRTLEGLMSLAEKSLSLPLPLDDQDTGPSFRVLETVREYAAELLEQQGERGAAWRAHAAYFIALAERADPELRGRDQLIWLRRLGAQHDNFRAALRRLLDAGEGEQALRLTGALGHFWWLRGYYTEGGRWLEEALDRASDVNPGIRIRALLAASLLLGAREDRGPSAAALQEALALAEAHGDRAALARGLLWLGNMTVAAGDLPEAERLLQTALAHWEELGDDYHIATTLAALAGIRATQGDYQAAAECEDAAMVRLTGIGEVVHRTNVLFGLALMRSQLNDRVAAAQMLEEGLTTGVSIQERWLISSGVQVTLIVVGESGPVQRRAQLLGAGDALAEATGMPVGLWETSPGPRLTALREQIERDPELQAVYRAGRTLALEDAAALAQGVVEDYSRTLTAGDAGEQRPAAESPLSARELEVLQLVAQGLSSKEIGGQLFISHRTVEHHLTAIFNKLGVSTRAQAVAVATQRGLL